MLDKSTFSDHDHSDHSCDSHNNVTENKWVTMSILMNLVRSSLLDSDSKEQTNSWQGIKLAKLKAAEYIH